MKRLSCRRLQVGSHLVTSGGVLIILGDWIRKLCEFSGWPVASTEFLQKFRQRAILVHHLRTPQTPGDPVENVTIGLVSLQLAQAKSTRTPTGPT